MPNTEPPAGASDAEQTNFTLLSPHSEDPAARLGRLEVPGRSTINTPHYLALSSRGCIPHVTPDVMLSSTRIQGVYSGFEDYAEALPNPPPFTTLSSTADSPLRTFTALPPSPVLVLGPRRHPAIPAPTLNTPTSLNVSTSVGFRQMPIPSYLSALSSCGSDIGLAAADIDIGSRDELAKGRGVQEMTRQIRQKPGRKRADNMVERSRAWIKGALTSVEAHDGHTIKPQLWAPILPIDVEVQRTYLEILNDAAEEGRLSGVVLYENASLEAVPKNMKTLPLLALTEPKGPSEVLDAVGLGIDLVTMPFITRATEAGIAFTFEFPAPSPSSKSGNERIVLGVDMWHASHARDTSALAASCVCYACQRHHRAYIQHLLQAKEMLAWVLLQVHNHWMMDNFFEGVRKSIASGTFDEDVDTWKRAYEPDLPEFVGQGPRIRGYQSCTSGPLPAKKNKSPYTRLDKKAEIPARPNDRKEKLKEGEEEQVLSEKTNALDLEDVGFAKVFHE